MSDDAAVAAIRDALGGLAETAMVGQWVAIATTTDVEGDQAVHVVSDCDHAWQVLGLLRHAQLLVEVGNYHHEEDEG